MFFVRFDSEKKFFVNQFDFQITNQYLSKVQDIKIAVKWKEERTELI